MKEAAVGIAVEAKANKGFDSAEIAAFLRKNASELERAKLPSRPGISPEAIAFESAKSLNELADEIEKKASLKLEDLEQRLTVLEEKLLAILLAAIPDDEVVAVRVQADRELAPYRSKMPAAQIDQLLRQFVHKRLLEKYGIPRLSLFYL
jgi:hypothetical protein